jgi:hypothetical protein
MLITEEYLSQPGFLDCYEDDIIVLDDIQENPDVWKCKKLDGTTFLAGKVPRNITRASEKYTISVGDRVLAHSCYISNEPTKLSHNVGDIIYVLEPPKGEWMFGARNWETKIEQRGWFLCKSVIISCQKDVLSPRLSEIERKQTNLESKSKNALLLSDAFKTSISPAKSTTDDASIVDRKKSLFGFKSGKFEETKNKRARAVSVGQTASHGARIHDIINKDSIFRASSVSEDALPEDAKIILNSPVNGSNVFSNQNRAQYIKQFCLNEKEYLADLRTLINEFLKPIISNKLMTPKQIISIFSNIEQIEIVSIEVLNHWEAINNLNDTDEISTICRSMADRFINYIPYLSNHNGIKQVLSVICSKNDGNYNILRFSKSVP